MNRARVFVLCVTVLVIVLTSLLLVSARKSRKQATELARVNYFVEQHCFDGSMKLREAEQNLRETLPVLSDPSIGPEQRTRAENHAYSSSLGGNALRGDARGVLSLGVLAEGYFCIQTSRLSERERDELSGELARQTQAFNEARDPTEVAQSLGRLNAILVRVASSRRQQAWAPAELTSVPAQVLRNGLLHPTEDRVRASVLWRGLNVCGGRVCTGQANSQTARRWDARESTVQF
jgi:hypothetical protein